MEDQNNRKRVHEYFREAIGKKDWGRALFTLALVVKFTSTADINEQKMMEACEIILSALPEEEKHRLGGDALSFPKSQSGKPE